MAEAQRLSLEDMNARLRAPAPKRLSLDEMDAMLRGGMVEVDEEERPDALSPTSRPLAREPSEVPSSVRARSTMADFPSPMNLPPPEAELEALRQASAAAKRLPSSHGRPVQQPALGERFRHNLDDALDNTIRGAMVLIPPRKPDLGVYEPGFETALELVGSPLEGISDSPLGQAVREQAARDHAAEQAAQAEAVKAYRQRHQFPLPSPQGPLQVGAAVAGQLAGSATSPESLIPVTRGPTLLNTFLRGATVAGIANLATDPIVQQAQIDAGLRETMDPLQPFLSAAGGAFLGGTLNVTPEIASSVARAVGTQIGKAADRVTNSDVWRAMRGWLRSPDRMPDELKIEPTFDRSAAPSEPALGIEGDAGLPPSPFREHAIAPGTTPAREPAYQGAARGEPFALPSRKPEPPGLAPATPTPAPAATSAVSGTARPDPTAAPAARPAPIIPPGAKLGPPRFGPGDAGSLGKAVPTTHAGLVSILDRADARRFRPKANKAYREAAEEQRQAFLVQMDEAAAAAANSDAARVRQAAAAQAGQAHASPSLIDDYRKGFIRAATDETVPVPRVANAWAEGLKAGKTWRAASPKPAEPEFREVRLQTLHGRETVYRLRNDPEVINDFRSRFTREADVEKFYHRTPEAAPTAAMAPSGVPPAKMSLAQMQQRASTAPAGTQQATTMNAAPGAAYVGPRAQTFDPAVATVKDPLRRESILRAFTKGMGMPIYTGRIRSKKILGFFRPSVGEVRVKTPNDIETAGHEMAHLLDKQVPEIRRQWHPATKANAAIRKELAGVSYDASKLYEGFAEFVRLWMTQTPQAQAKAPQFHQWFENFVARSKYGPTLRRAQRDMMNWFEQAALDRARSKVGPGDDINGGLVLPFDRFRQTVTDDLHGIAQMERSLTGKLSPVGAYETARLTRGASAIVEGALTMGAPRVNADGSHSFVGKGLQQILDPVADEMDDFLMYAVGRSASELMAQGRERLFTAAEIKGMLALEAPEFRKAFDEYQTWNKRVLDFAEAKGIIDPAFRATWRRTQYLPFHRVSQGSGQFQPVPGDWRGIRALTGGGENLRPILGNMIQNAATLIQAALTNEARLKVANLASQPGGARFMAKIPKEVRAVRVHRDEIESAIIEALGVKDVKQLPVDMQQIIDQIVSGMSPMTSLLLRGQTPTGRNIVATLSNGRPTYWEVADPLVFRALTALRRPAASWVVRWLSVPKRIGQASITLTPDFMARNILRDTLSGFVMSRHGFKPFVDSASGFVSRLKADQTYREFIANGGGFSSYLADETAFRTHLEKFYTKKGIDYRTVLDAPSKLLYGLERIAEAFEQATRLGEFRQAVTRGEHPRHAAYGAREVSTDFAMRGDAADPGVIMGPVGQAIGFLYDTAIFVKAGVNGIDRFYRGLAADPNRGAIAAKTGLLAALSMGLYAMNRGNPLYENLEDWDRDTHWHFFLPTPETLTAWRDRREPPSIEERYIHLRMPKIWEIGAISSISERQLQGVLDKQPLKAQQDSLSVVAKLMGFEYLPQLFAPLYEVATNRDRFTGRQIETQAMQELAPWARSGASTSRTMRALGENVLRRLPRGAQVLSPAQIEHLIEGYLNTWGIYGLTLADAAFFDDRPDVRWDQLPVIRSFYRGEPAVHTKWITKLYDMIDSATEARRTMRSMDRRWRPEIADELAESAENTIYKQASFADKRMRGFRQEMNAVYEAKTVADVMRMVQERARVTRTQALVAKARGLALGAMKRLLLDDILRERNAFAESVAKDMEKRHGELQATGTGP